MAEIKNIQITAVREKQDGETVLRWMGKATLIAFEGTMEIHTGEYFAENEERARNAFRAKLEYGFLGTDNPFFSDHDFWYLQQEVYKAEIKYITRARFFQMAERQRQRMYE